MSQSETTCTRQYPSIDELTGRCLDLARSPDESRSIHQGLQAFFRDIRHRLNQHKLGLFVAKRSGGPPSESVWSGLERSYGSIERLVERFERICRPAEPTPLACDLDLLLSDRRPAWDAAIARAGGAIDWDAPEVPVIARFDPVSLLRALDGFVAWRGDELATGARVRVEWRRVDDRVTLRWEESAETSAPRGVGSTDEIPLALPLLASVVTAHGGTLEVGRREGLLVDLSLPSPMG